jgi:glycosyltransferase involved in cell wall biosynthesis
VGGERTRFGRAPWGGETGREGAEPDRRAGERVNGRNERHVLFVTQTAHPWGGVEEWLASTAGALVRSGWRVTVGLARGAAFHLPERYLAIHPYLETVEVDGTGGTRELRIRALERSIRAVAPDVVVPVNIAEVLEAARRLRRGGSRIRCVYPMHALLGCQFHDIAEYRDVVDHSSAASRLAVKALAELSGMDKVRVTYAPYATPAPVKGRQRHVDRECLRIGFAGRLAEEQKCVSVLAETLQTLHTRGVGFRCEIAGSGPAESALVARLAPFVQDGAVLFLGYRPREALYESFYPGIDVFLVTSDWETGPIVAWEAMRHGAAVVSTRYLGCAAEASLVDGQTALLAPVGDAVGLARAVERLSNDEALRIRIAEAGRRVADERYCQNASEAAWVDAFEEVLGHPPITLPLREPDIRPSGRLERAFGSTVARLLRRFAGRVPPAGDAGSEWPHTLSEWPGGELAFREELKRLEADWCRT